MTKVQSSLTIVADEDIPYVRELFGSFGELRLAAGRTMTCELLDNADALIVRSVTQVNHTLLARSKVKFVGTCTIGTDHLDLEQLASRQAKVASAPGCNANAVVQYVVAALAQLGELSEDKRHKKVAIVGFGNVGSRVYQALNTLGFECVCVDPFKSLSDCEDLRPFHAIYECDIVCLHAPLTHAGPHPTYHMFSSEELQQLKPGCILLNAGRGAVIDNEALLKHMRTEPGLRLVLDVWEGEPAIRSDLFPYVKLGTSHIAGHSVEGRVTGSLMIFNAFAEYLGLDQRRRDDILDRVKAMAFGEPVKLGRHSLMEAILRVYPIGTDHQLLEQALSGLPESFDRLRKTYFKRREFSHYILDKQRVKDTDNLESLGFLIQ